MFADFTGHAAIAVTITMIRMAQPAVVVAAPISAWRERVVPGAVPALVAASWVVGFATMELPVLLAGSALLIAATGLAAAHLWWERPTPSPDAEDAARIQPEPATATT